MLPGKLCMSELTSLPQKKLITNKVTKFVWDYGSYHLFLELVSDELTTQKKNGNDNTDHAAPCVSLLKIRFTK